VGRVIREYLSMMFHVGQCTNCPDIFQGQDSLIAIKAHVKANPTHRVAVEQVNRSSYRWEE